MQISKEFLLEAVGLSLLVALIFISMQMFQRTIRVTSLLESEQEETIIRLEEYEITKYDGFLIDGLTAVNYMKKIVEEYRIPVIVEFEQASFSISEREELAELRDIDSEKYISPYVMYRCMVVRDENDVITEIRLVKK